MTRFLDRARDNRFVLASSFIYVIGAAVFFASAQFGNAKAGPPRQSEYLHQEVQANTITQSLNDFDGQGWEIFQVVPVWQIKNENAETQLVPKSYEVFGRRRVAAK